MQVKGDKSSALGAVQDTSAVGTDDTPSVDPIDRFERRDRTTAEQREQSRRTGSLAQFTTDLVHWLGRSKPVVAAVMAGTMLPMISGCALSVETDQQASGYEIQISAEAASAETILRTALFVTPDHAYVQHVDSIRKTLVDGGHDARATNVPIWVLTDDDQAPGMLRVIADARIGLAPGADIRLDRGGRTSDVALKTLQDEVSAGLAQIGRGDAPSDKLIRELAQSMVWLDADRIHRVRQRRVEGRTNLVVLGDNHSPRSVARRILTQMVAAPIGSPAHEALLALGPATEHESELADQVAEVLDGELGSRAVNAATRKLRSELAKARDEGLLVLRPTGDTRRIGQSTRPSRPLADDLEHIVTVGASVFGERSMHDWSSSGVTTIAAPADAFPVGDHGANASGSNLAAAYATGAAALVLAASPDAAPDELEHLLMVPGARDNVLATGRDGLGIISVVNAVGATRSPSRDALPTLRQRRRAIKALQSAPDIAVDHPYVQHIAGVRAELGTRGLPTRGDGITVYVIERGWSDHGGNIFRTIADEAIGLAPGADVRLVTESTWYNARERTLSSQTVEDRQAILDGGLPSDRLIRSIAEKTVLSRAADVRDIANEVDGTETVFVNMSFGTTSSSIAEDILSHLADAPADSEAAKYYAVLGNTTELRHHRMVEYVAGVLNQPATQTRIHIARGQLADELRAARDKRVMVYTSAGNARDEVPSENSGYSTHIADSVPGLMVVGATEINDPLTVTDDRISAFSSEGRISFATPGVDMPIRLWGGDARGTSYAAPYGIAVGILMVAANPDLTPDQIEAIQTKSDAVHDIPTDLDGAGALDVVRAVELAAQRR